MLHKVWGLRQESCIFQEIKFYEIIGNGRCSTVYKCYIRNADRDKNPAPFQEIKFYGIIGND